MQCNDRPNSQLANQGYIAKFCVQKDTSNSIFANVSRQRLSGQ